MSGPLIFDRVQETTTTMGTGSVILLGAVSDRQSFAVVGDGNSCYYCIAGRGTGEWETGIGTYTASGTTLSRSTILASSNGGSTVDLSAGTKDVFIQLPAAVFPLPLRAPFAFTPPAASAFTAAGSATLTDATERLLVTGSASGNMRGASYNTSVPGVAYSIVAALGFIGVNNSSDSALFGIGLTDGTKYRNLYFGTGSSQNGAIVVDSWNTVSSFNTTTLSRRSSMNGGLYYLKITDDLSTTRTFQISNNGLDWLTLMSESRTTFLTPTKATLAYYNNGSASGNATGIVYHFKQA